MTEQLKLETDETIVRYVRKHWFILFARTVGVIFSAIIPPIFLFAGLIGAESVPNLVADTSELYGPAAFFSAVWLLIMWMTLFGIWTDYYLDAWVVTTKRVIAIDQQGFFKRQVASFRLERLQNITVEIDGIIATFLNYGRIKADTASHAETFVINGIPDPRGIKALIQEHADSILTAQTPQTAVQNGGH
jgi:hypothetical protein